MKRFILHIGSNKTGSTTIQHGLHELRETPNIGFAYPKAGTHSPKTQALLPTRQVGLRLAFQGDSSPADSLTRRFGILTSEDRQQYRSYFVDEFDREVGQCDPGQPVIVSDESFFILSSDELAHGVAQFLRARFDSVEIVVYLRRPDLYLTSKYSQYVKGGGVESFPSFFKRQRGSVRYGKKLVPWIDAFGTAAMIVRCFDRRCLHDGDIMSDFFSVIGLPAPTTTPMTKNQSLDGLGIEVLRRLNKHFATKQTPTPGVFTRLLTKHFAGKADFLTQNQRRELLGLVRDDDESLRRYIGPEKFQGFYDVEDIVLSATEPPEPVDTDVAAQIAKMMIDMQKSDPQQNESSQPF